MNDSAVFAGDIRLTEAGTLYVVLDDNDKQCVPERDTRRVYIITAGRISRLKTGQIVKWYVMHLKRDSLVTRKNHD